MIRDIKFQKASLQLLDKIKNILQEYERQEITVTTRQLYYQLVSAGVIANTQSQYKKISTLLTNARYCGIINWENMEDRTRKPIIPNTFTNVPELWEAAKNSYHLYRWERQEYYVELWTEKDALTSVIVPITQKYQVPMVVNRGYGSASSMHESAERFLKHENKILILLYLGDHDASGMDMDRDIQERLNEFGVDVQTIRIGLTSEQVQEYKPPENLTKEKDTRARGYIEKYGESCWEVDALKPEVLQELIESSILQYLDLEEYEKIKEQEQKDLMKYKLEEEHE